MTPTAINLSHKLGLFTEQWSPKIIAEMDGFQFKLARLQGDFVWHSHPETDEAFIILEGQLRIDFRDSAVTLNKGEMLIVKNLDNEYVPMKGNAKGSTWQVGETESEELLVVAPEIPAMVRVSVLPFDAFSEDQVAPDFPPDR